MGFKKNPKQVIHKENAYADKQYNASKKLRRTEGLNTHEVIRHTAGENKVQVNKMN